LVLTHFSQRYDDPAALHDEAAEHFGGDIVVASDLSRVPVPPRH
jgi:ribonuclease Z